MKHIYKFQIKIQSSLLLLLVSVFFFSQCQIKNDSKDEDTEFIIRATNLSIFDRSGYLLQLPLEELKNGDTEVDYTNLVVFDGEAEVPTQLTEKSLLLLIDELKANEERDFKIKKGKPSLNLKKRSQAEISVKTGGHFENRKYIGGDFENIEYLRVPDEHTDHSYYIRYEGPGWESDLVGYRFYLDWRNATDVFGKKTNEMVLQKVGLDGFDSYHEMQDWGLDVLKVGSSLGIGSLGMYVGDKAIRVDQTDSIICAIAENGAIYSEIDTKYYGWEVDGNSYDVSSKISIHAGTRLSHHKISISGQPENLCTGIGKDSNAKLYTEQGNDDSWGYIATYGLQSLNNDQLGLAVLFAHEDYKGFTEDEFSHIVKLDVESGLVDYYFLAAWEGELKGIKGEDEFLTFVKETAQKLAKPVEIKVEQ